VNGSLKVCVHELEDQVEVFVVFGTVNIEKTNYVWMITEIEKLFKLETMKKRRGAGVI
jgi:hypothetical protein